MARTLASRLSSRMIRCTSSAAAQATGMRLVGLAVQEAAGAVGQRPHDPVGDQDAADRLVAAAEALGDDLDVGGDAFLLPGVHGAGAAHAAHHLVQDQQRAVAVADLAHALEIAGQGGDAAGGGADHRFGEERHDGVGAEALELGVQFVGQPVEVLRVGFAVVLEAIGEAGRHQAVRLGQDRLVLRPPHHVAAGRQRAQRGAVIGLPAGDGAGALGLADLQEVLPGELDRGFVALGARGAEPGAGQAAGFVVQHDVRQILGRLVGERAGVGIGHGGGLAPDRLGDAAVAVAEAGHRGAARARR